MKFTESTRLFLAIIIIYLTAFAELAQIESSIKLSLKAQKKKLNNQCKNSFNISRKKKPSNSSNIQISTKKDLKQGCATMYKDCDFKGKSLTVCDDISFLRFQLAKRSFLSAHGPKHKNDRLYKFRL